MHMTLEINNSYVYRVSYSTKYKYQFAFVGSGDITSTARQTPQTRQTQHDRQTTPENGNHHLTADKKAPKEKEQQERNEQGKYILLIFFLIF